MLGRLNCWLHYRHLEGAELQSIVAVLAARVA
jgi:hypothetical protein